MSSGTVVSSDAGIAGYLRLGDEALGLCLLSSSDATSRALHGCPRLCAALLGQEDVLGQRLRRK